MSENENTIDYGKIWSSNPMLKPFIDKVVLNIAVGEGGESLEKAKNVLFDLTGQISTSLSAKKSIKEFNVRKGQNISAKVTLRGQKAIDFVKRFLHVTDNRILKKSFDNKGNFSMGLDEHIKLPKVKYNPEYGIFGFNLAVKIVRPGFRVRSRKKFRNKIGKKHYLSKEEAIYFMESEIKAEVVDKMEDRYY